LWFFVGFAGNSGLIAASFPTPACIYAEKQGISRQRQMIDPPVAV